MSERPGGMPADVAPAAVPRMSQASAGAVLDILEDVRRRLGMDVALVSHFEDDQRVVDVVGSQGPAALAAGDRHPVEESYCGRVVDGTLPETVPDTSAEPVARALLATTELDIRAHVGVPIVLDDGAVYGAVCTYSHRPRPDLDERAATVLGLVADTIARALAHEVEASRAHASALDRIDTLLSGDLLEMAYQPVVDLASRKVVAVEALARFPSGMGGTPSDWFSEAVTVGAGRALELACLAQVRAQLHLLPADLGIHLNLSAAVLLHRGTPAALADLPLDRFVLELTEHQVVEDYQALNDALDPLRAAGVRLAIDDAGAGFASFRHALLLKPDFLKLDISLVRGIDGDPAQRSLCQALTGFAHATGARVVAEGVETEEEAGALHKLGADLAQGYLFAAPGALAALLERDGVGAAPPQGTAAGSPDDEAAEIAAVVTALTAAGASPRTIAAALNQQGLLAPSGRRWHPTSVTRLLLG